MLTFDLGNLKVLDLNSNYLTEIPPQVSCLDLNELYISKNRIQKLNLSVLHKNKLEVLHVDGNEFEWINVDIVNFTKLKTLKLDW